MYCNALFLSPSNPIAKTFSFLSKNKGDKVCGDPDKPTKEDIKRWARSFDDLLHHPRMNF